MSEALNGMALFAGAGGLELGLHLALGDAYRTVVYVEREAYAAATLVGRMEDQALDQAPIWDDVSTFDGRPWRGVVDLISGGFPCQDISTAGRGEGVVKGNRSGLWFEYGRIIGEVGPRIVFVENVSALAFRGLDIVLGTLADLGFDAEWMCLGAGDIGATHQRDRLFILAHANGAGQSTRGDEPVRSKASSTIPCCHSLSVADAKCCGRENVSRLAPQWRQSNAADGGGDEVGNSESFGTGAGRLRERVSPAQPFPPGPGDTDAWKRVLGETPALEPAVCGMADGMADRVERLRLCGNGVVPVVAATAFHTLAGRLGIMRASTGEREAENGS